MQANVVRKTNTSACEGSHDERCNVETSTLDLDAAHQIEPLNDEGLGGHDF
jgi:hypothetical protein